MGGLGKPQKCYVYSASAQQAYNCREDPVFTVEMCMTGLDRAKAGVFYKSETTSAVSMTNDSCIRKILPDSKVCDSSSSPVGTR